MTACQILDSHHVARYCKPSAISPNGMPAAKAFLPRETESYLSVNWLEYFGALDHADAVAHVRAALREKGYTVRATGRLAVLNVGEAKDAARRTNTTLRVEHQPAPDDPSHAGITGYSSGDLVVALTLQSLVRNECLFPGAIVAKAVALYAQSVPESESAAGS